MITVKKPLVTSEKRYVFVNNEEKLKKANTNICKALRESQKRQIDGLRYAAQFRAK